MKKLISLVSIIILSTNLLLAQIINIPADYPTIQEGIDAAVDGDTVLVAPGTYYENLYISKGIVLTSYYLTTLDTSYISQTIIDGNQNGTVVRFNCYYQLSAELIGFTIINGLGDNGGGVSLLQGKFMNLSHLVIKNNSASYGGGLYNENTYLTLNDVKVINNSATNNGGGILNGHLFWSAYPSIIAHNVTIENNQAGSKGGGFYNHEATFEFFYSEFVNNSSENGGGLWFSWEGISYLENVKVLGNTATNKGGGVLVGDYTFYEFRNVEIGYNNANNGGGMFIAGPLIVNNQTNLLIHDNIAENKGGGLYHSYGSFNGVNVTIANNEADMGTGIYCSQSNLTLKNSIIYSNSSQQIVCNPEGDSSTITVSNSLIMGGQYYIETNGNASVEWLEGNINQNPQFVNSGDYPYQINDNSPCIDAGSTDTTGITEFDLAGEPRFFNGHIDMGAYEWNTFVGIEEPILSSSNWNINIYPNPFTTTTTFSYTLQQPSTVQITIFNHLGEQVEVIRQQQPSGKQQVTWNAEGQPSGVYYYRMQAGNQIASGKMILVR